MGVSAQDGSPHRLQGPPAHDPHGARVPSTPHDRAYDRRVDNYTTDAVRGTAVPYKPHPGPAALWILLLKVRNRHYLFLAFFQPVYRTQRDVKHHVDIQDAIPSAPSP